MKNSTLITILSTFLLVGCSKQQPTLDKKLGEAENIIEVNPDSAPSILESITSPEQLDDKAFARWRVLSDKITDEIFNALLPSYQFERTGTWYSSYGKSNRQIQILTYLGCSYANDGDYDRVMSIYTKALETGEKNKLYNLVGYAYSYTGDLYTAKAMRIEAIKKHEMAANNFKEENNTDSYACALRDIGRGYACIDSISRALEVLIMTDSMAETSGNKNVEASIENTLGNIYVVQNKYGKAKKLFYKTLERRSKMPNYMALVDLYIASDSVNQAREFLRKIPQGDPTYTCSIEYLYYQIYKSEKKYEQALVYLEEYTDLVDSIVYTDNQPKILNIESKYGHLKISREVNNLRMKQRSYIIVSVIYIAALLLMIIGYLLYRRQAKEKILKQQKGLDKMELSLYTLSLEFGKRRNLLSTFKREDENYDKIQKEINHLFTNYRKLQNKILVDSPLYKELVSLTNKNMPRVTAPLISKGQWELIVNEITGIYPNLYNCLFSLCPTLSGENFRYCCFYLCGFNTSTGTRLLNIATGSVRGEHNRLKEKLNVTLPSNSTLYKYLMKNMGQPSCLYEYLVPIALAIYAEAITN